MYPTLSRDQLSTRVEEKPPVKALLNPPTSTKVKQRTVTIETESAEWHRSIKLTQLWDVFFDTEPLDDRLAPYLKNIRTTLGTRVSQRKVDDLAEFWSQLQTQDLYSRLMAVLEYLENELVLPSGEDDDQPMIDHDSPSESSVWYDQMVVEPLDEPYHPLPCEYRLEVQYGHWHTTMIPYRDRICLVEDIPQEKEQVAARYLYEVRKMLFLLSPDDLVQFNEQLDQAQQLEPLERLEAVHQWLMNQIFAAKLDEQITLEEEMRHWPSDWATTRRRLINIPLLSYGGYAKVAKVMQSLRRVINDLPGPVNPRTIIDQALLEVNMNQSYEGVLTDLILVIQAHKSE
jgi:hypothetical protein